MFDCCYSSGRRSIINQEKEHCVIDKPIKDNWTYTIETDGKETQYKHTFQVKDSESNIYHYTMIFNSKVSLTHVLHIKAIRNLFRCLSPDDARVYTNINAPKPTLVPIVIPKETITGVERRYTWRPSMIYPQSRASPIDRYEYKLIKHWDYNVPPVAYAILFPSVNKDGSYHFFKRNGDRVLFANTPMDQIINELKEYAFYSGIFSLWNKQPVEHYHVGLPHKIRYQEQHGTRSGFTRIQRAEAILTQLQTVE